MSKENKSVEDIFHAALETVSKGERKDFLNDACVDDLELRREVEELLRTHELAENFLESPPYAREMTSNTDSNESSNLAETQLPKPFHQTKFDHGDSGHLPRFFGDYELLEKIARGGMGVIYKARQVSLNRIVAIKMILAGQFAGDDEVKRFHIEAEAAAHLDHPGIVPVFEVGSCEGQHYFSMGYVDGKSLADEIKEGPLPPRTAALHVKKIAAAAHFAHENGIVHRDLKPGNILLDNSGEPRVTDFGVAKRTEADNELTTTGMVIGTPSYMPPEQASGRLDQINASADVYSLGAILYALLTGRPPFDGTNQAETLTQVLHDEPVDPRQIVHGIPKDLEAICLKCLEKDPGARYDTAADLATDLQQFLAGEPIRAKNDIMRRLRKWTLREPVLAAHLLATLAMMTIILINYWVFGHGKDSLDALYRNQGILAAWAATVLLLQKIHNIIKGKYFIPLTWAATNPLFLTVTLAANDAPRGALASLYLLLLVTMCFFRRIELVAITTISSLIGYVVLVILIPESEPVVTPPSYKVIFGVTLAVTGVLLGLLVHRLNRLSQKDSL